VNSFSVSSEWRLLRVLGLVVGVILFYLILKQEGIIGRER
jgi:hypothetical protein